MRDRTEDQVILAFIRHGRTLANEQHRYLGKTDESLSEQGIQLLLSYKEKGRYPKVDYLFTSPMKRCIETAGILYPALKPVVIPEWEEIDFGRFEYKRYDELMNDAWYQEWVESRGSMDFPGGESREAFIRRCESGFFEMCGILRAMVGDNARKPIRAGLIVHGGTIMALLSSHGEKGYFAYQTANGGGYLCSMDGWNERTAPGDGRETAAKSRMRIKETAEI